MVKKKSDKANFDRVRKELAIKAIERNTLAVLVVQRHGKAVDAGFTINGDVDEKLAVITAIVHHVNTVVQQLKDSGAIVDEDVDNMFV